MASTRVPFDAKSDAACLVRLAAVADSRASFGAVGVAFHQGHELRRKERSSVIDMTGLLDQNGLLDRNGGYVRGEAHHSEDHQGRREHS